MSIEITRSAMGIVTCTLNNPQRRNALNGAMLQSLCETYETAGRDNGIRAVVLRGAHGTFCAGRDLRELEARQDDSDATITERIAPVTRLAQAVRQCVVPTIAVVEGKAVGLGVALASWCDLVLAAEDAIFLVPEARAGIVPTYTAVSLAQAIGQRQALAMCLGGRSVDAKQAQTYGLVQQVCGASELDDSIDALCQSLMVCGPHAMRQCKDLLVDVNDLPFEVAIERAQALSVSSMRSAEALEGMQAVLAKRPPAWAQPPQQDE